MAYAGSIYLSENSEHISNCRTRPRDKRASNNQLKPACEPTVPPFHLPAAYNDYRYVPCAEPRQRQIDATNGSSFNTHNKQSTITSNPISKGTKAFNETRSDAYILNPSFTDYEARLNTYPPNWKYESIVSKFELAKYGWIWIGKADHVMCFRCQGLKRHWKENETALGEHKRLYPNCEFILDTLSKIFASPEQSQTQLSLPSNAATKRMEEDAVKSILQLDMCSLQEMDNAISILLQNGEPLTSENLMDVLLSPSVACPLRKEVENSRQISNASPKLRKTDLPKSSSQKQTPVDPPKTFKQIEKETEQMKTRTTCKVCMDGTVGVLFLPCRHLICCQSCADNVSTCPLCRAQIVATIKAFL